MAVLSIRTERSEYRPLEWIVVTTRNVAGTPVYDDHCGGEVQGLEFLGRWNASYGTGRACLWPDPAKWRSYSVVIPPGAVHVDSFHVNGRAYAGTWRVELRLRDESGALLPEEQRVSNTFRVDIP